MSCVPWQSVHHGAGLTPLPPARGVAAGGVVLDGGGVALRAVGPRRRRLVREGLDVAVAAGALDGRVDRGVEFLDVDAVFVAIDALGGRERLRRGDGCAEQ